MIERDDGYIDAMGSKGYFNGYKDWHSIEQKAMGFVKGKVLDVGCGAGRHSIYLQKKGVGRIRNRHFPTGSQSQQAKRLEKS